jgi:cyanate lyase
LQLPNDWAESDAAPAQFLSSNGKLTMRSTPWIGTSIANSAPDAGAGRWRETAMTRADLTEKILDIKREKGWSWKYICEKIGGYSPVLLVGALLGQMKLTKPQAANAADLFGLSKAEAAMLNEVPMRGAGVPMPPTDPLIYRFYELVMVNGPAWKALIEEEFGDGIMSAIDFDMQIERLPNPKGDRVKITMSGKFLPYKYYGNSGNVPEYGYKEG